MIFCGVIFLTSCGKAVSQQDLAAQQNIKKAYQEWVYKKVKSGENWYESKWEAENDKNDKMKGSWEEFYDRCKEGLPDDFFKIHYGDINRDGRLDGIATILPLPCQSGTAFNFYSIELFIISTPDSYKTTADPEIVRSSIGIASEVDTINEKGIIIYTVRDYGAEDPNCCPSLESKVKFKYEKGRIVKIK